MTTDNTELEQFEWKIDGDANDLIYISREESYPYRLILTQEQADNIDKQVWETIKNAYIIRN